MESDFKKMKLIPAIVQDYKTNEIIKISNKEKKSIINEIYNQIEDRQRNPLENSYTNYLLNCGIDKICKKIGEEATETVIAAKNSDKSELVGEISDLIYHILVLMYCKGVEIENVQSKLEERHKIQGNKKKENIKGEY